MPMLIQLDHILKNLKNSIFFTLMIGISILFLSCSDQEFKIIDTSTEVTNISVYQAKSSNFKSNEYDDILLFQSYPNLKLAIKLSNPNVNITNIKLTSPNKDLLWDIEPNFIEKDTQQYIGSSFINLVSYYFEEGDYELELTSDDGKYILKTITLTNPFKDINNINLYLKDNLIMFTSKAIKEDLPFVSTLVPFELGDLIVNYYNNEKNLIDTKKYENNFIYQNYQFQIEIDNFENVYYIELIYEDSNSIINNLKIDLSSTHSFL